MNKDIECGEKEWTLRQNKKIENVVVKNKPVPNWKEAEVSLCYWGMMKVTKWIVKDFLAESGSTDIDSTGADWFAYKVEKMTLLQQVLWKKF